MHHGTIELKSALRFLEVKDLLYRLSPGKYRNQTCVPITREFTQIRHRRQ